MRRQKKTISKQAYDAKLKEYDRDLDKARDKLLREKARAKHRIERAQNILERVKSFCQREVAHFQHSYNMAAERRRSFINYHKIENYE